MVQKRRTIRALTKASIGDEIAYLRDLDLKGLRSRWQSVFQRPPPEHLPRHLLFAIIAYQVQADCFGDLDHETRQVLDRTGADNMGSAVSARLVASIRNVRNLRRGPCWCENGISTRRE